MIIVNFVLEGTYIVRFGNHEYKVHKNEMVLLQKAIVIEYEKYGESDLEYTLDYMMFFIKDELISEFIKMSAINYTLPFTPVLVKEKFLQVNCEGKMTEPVPEMQI